MIRSALLALDNSQASLTALEMAISFCQRYAERNDTKPHAIHLTGVAVVDIPGIKAPTSMPIGASGHKKRRDEALIEDANKTTEEILSYFESRCREADIPHQGIRSEGLPYEQIETAARTHDIILIGRDTNFHYETSESVGATMKQLLVDNARPVIVYPAQLPDNHRVVIAYDGSNAASHALHMWTLLEIRSPQTEIHIVSISDEQSVAEQRCQEAARLLAFHGCQAILRPEVRTRAMVDQMAEIVQQLSPRMVVMGAYGRGGLKEYLFGSTTNRLLEQAQCPLFLSK